MYMASLGGSGFKALARLNYDKSEYLKEQLSKAGHQIAFTQSTFNEFVVRFPKTFNATYQELIKKGIIAGLPLECYYPELCDHYLLCVTETMSREDMDRLVNEIG
jgi:glycine dehydrogenase subunit 1